MRIGVTVGWIHAALRGMTIMALAGLAGQAAANNIRVSNVGLRDQNTGAQTVRVAFDLSWDNSWRGSENWDAAWVFVKFRAPGSNNWEHAKLSAGSVSHTAPGGMIAVGTDGANGMGVFIYRAGGYTGSVNYASTKLQWNYGSNGYDFVKGALVEVSVHAIEMVYIPQGSFFIGSGGTEVSHFYQYTDGSQSTNPFLISTEATNIAVSASGGNLFYVAGTYSGDALGIISNTFPKGYAAFYCMKYEVSQGQYVDFLNKLTSAQATTRYYASTLYRYTISGSYTNFTAGVPDRACNHLTWADGSAYADWAALRSMTELEFEKACRGTANPVANEYAWGSTSITQLTAEVADGTGTSRVSTVAGANCNYGNGLGGPTRVGIFATTNSTRQSSGAGYYGVMELSGNICEYYVTVGKPAGRVYIGTHGNGVLDVNGNATGNADWPGAGGAGFRGGDWAYASSNVRVSERNEADREDAGRYQTYGWRGARTAP